MLIKVSYILTVVVLKSSTFDVKVKVKQGTILGLKEMTIFREKIYYAFYRVPYAQTPMGKLRFKDSKPIKKWAKPLDATKEYHGACAQDHIVHKHGLYGFEDCLYLNIYTPQLPKHGNKGVNAVIVWIHGYAFTSSFSHIYGPDFLIENDIIVVTLTHRIGAFGFLKMNETDYNGNMGLKDIVLALQWIGRNIGQFGGDKKKITLMASGSASTYISLLLVTKYSKLFSKIILHSGSIFSPSIFQGNFLDEKNRLSVQLKKEGFIDVYNTPTEEIIKATRKLYGKKDIVNTQRSMIPFLPIVEKESGDSLLTKNVDEIYKSIKEEFTLPILIGFTSQESITEVIPFIHNPHYFKSFLASFTYLVPFLNGCKYKYPSKLYNTISNIIKKQYFKSPTEEGNIENLLKFVSDLYKYPIYKFIEARQHLESKIFAYKFNYIGKFNAAKATALAASKMKIKGAAQGDELCYIFRCNPLWESYVNLKYNNTDRDKAFIEQISQMWANFAKYGDPTPFHNFGNFTWLPISPNDNKVFLFDKQSRLTHSKSDKKMFEFWDDLYIKYYAPERCTYFKDEL